LFERIWQSLRVCKSNLPVAGMNTLRTLTRINQMKFARTCIALAAIVAPGKNLRTNQAGALFALNKLAQSN
jgi:hypothetical protein